MPYIDLPKTAIAVALSFCAAAAAAQSDSAPFTFGLWGDMPYAKADDAPYVPALLADMNAAGIAFSLYDGDIKDGSSECTDAVYTDAITMFETLTAPVVYVPGDNEWTDCHRINNGGHDNLERLAHLRATMFASADMFGQDTLGLTRQGAIGADYVENMRFSMGGAMFVGLNVPGSNNNRVPTDDSCLNPEKSTRTLEQCAADNAEWAARDAANISWLHDAFAAATAEGDEGLMIVIQGDPGFDIPETEDDNESRLAGKDGYAAFLDAVIAETQGFAGQVVLVHGDTHYFKIDRPLTDATHLLANFTRVQTFGSPNIHWIAVDVDATSRDVFTFHPMIVAENAMVGMAN